MMNKTRRAAEILRKEGPRSLLKKSIRHFSITGFYASRIWPHLPSTETYGTYNDVQVKGTHPMLLGKDNIEIQHKVLDSVVPWNTPSDIPDFKKSNVHQIREHYKKGDSVTIVGGGNGVSSVHSARGVGTEGQVTVYEADSNRATDLQRTLNHNGVTAQCSIEHAIVGQAHKVNVPADAEVIKPSELQECDALELDCEGAELDILKNLEIRPDIIIVELHHKRDFSPYSSKERIREELDRMGYSVSMHNGHWVEALFTGRLK